MPADEIDEAAAARALRRHVTRHNWQALMLAVFSFGAAAILWGIVYGAAYWLTLLGATLAVSYNPQTLLQATDPQLVGRYFPAEFAVGAVGALTLAAALGRWVSPGKLRERRWYTLWVLYELFMTAPNVTFAIWGNLRAIVRLRRTEAVTAWRLLERIRALGGRLRIASLAGESIDDEESLPHVLLVLQIAELLGVRENEEGWFYYLQNQEALARLMPLAPSRPEAPPPVFAPPADETFT